MIKTTDKLVIILILSISTVSTLTIDQQLINNSKESRILHKILRDITSNTEIHNVAVLLANYSPEENFMIDEILRFGLNNIPVNSIVSSNFYARKLWRSLYANTFTLLLYIYNSKDLSIFMKIPDITEILLPDGSHPKVLFLTFLEDEEADFHALLHYMWTKYVLDVTVLEVSKTNKSLVFTVHQYNPFSKKYTSQLYPSNVDWFPDKLENLYGHPIKVDLVRRWGYNSLHRDPQGNVVKYTGHDYTAMMALKDVMNFSIDIIRRPEDLLNLNMLNGTTISGIMRRVQHGDADVVLTTLPWISQLNSYVSHTRSFTTEKWCILMPVVYRSSSIEERRILRIIVGLIFFALIWLVSTFLKFQSHSWRALNIFRMIVGTSIYKFKVERLSEKVVFLFLVFVCAIYSSSLYADLSMTNLSRQVELDLESIDDLLSHGLTPIFHDSFFNATFRYDEGDFLKFKENVKIVDMDFDCGEYLLKYRNVSCFMEKKMAMIFVYLSQRPSSTPLKFNEKLCYWFPSNGFYFHKYSPYISRFSEIIFLSQHSGLRHKWFVDDFTDLLSPNFLARDFKNDKSRDGESTGIKINVFITIICGYVISILAFFGEHLAYRLKN